MPAKFLALVAKHPIRMLDKESSAGARVAKDLLREPNPDAVASWMRSQRGARPWKSAGRGLLHGETFAVI